jgi:antitoxin CptB
MVMAAHQDDPARRSRLRWRSRRGLLENDLILSRFLDAHELSLTDDDVDAFTRLMELPDNDLMGLLLGFCGVSVECPSDIAFGISLI